MLVLLILLIVPLIALAQLPPEYGLLLRYMDKRDTSIGYRILKEYPDAVFVNDLRLLLAQDELKAGRRQSATGS